MGGFQCLGQMEFSVICFIRLSFCLAGSLVVFLQDISCQATEGQQESHSSTNSGYAKLKINNFILKASSLKAAQKLHCAAHQFSIVKVLDRIRSRINSVISNQQRNKGYFHSVWPLTLKKMQCDSVCLDYNCKMTAGITEHMVVFI